MGSRSSCGVLVKMQIQSHNDIKEFDVPELLSHQSDWAVLRATQNEIIDLGVNGYAGLIIRGLKIKQGLTQKQIADKLHISERSIRHWVSMSRIPNFAHCKCLALLWADGKL